MKSLLRILLLGVFLAGAGPGRAQMVPGPGGPPTWWDQLDVNGSISSSWVQNISRTSYAPTSKDAMSYALNFGASRHREVASNWLWEAGADVDYLSVPKYDLTSSLTAGLRSGLRHKFGLGPMAPVLQLTTSLAYKAARFAGDRGLSAEGGFRLAQRLNDSVQLGVSGQWSEHFADSDIFDTRQQTVSADLSWDINDRWRLTGSAGRLQGYIVANAAGPVYATAIRGGYGPKVFSYYNAIPYGTTGLYGPGWVSYLVEAHADLWSVSLDHALTPDTAIELTASSAFVVNQVDVRYPQDTWKISLHHRF